MSSMSKLLVPAAFAVAIAAGFASAKASSLKNAEGYLYIDSRNAILNASIHEEANSEDYSSKGAEADPDLKEGTVVLCDGRSGPVSDVLKIGRTANERVEITLHSDRPSKKLKFCHGGGNEIDESTCGIKFPKGFGLDGANVCDVTRFFFKPGDGGELHVVLIASDKPAP